MPSRVFRIKSERVLEDNDSGDDDEDDQGLFGEFVIIDNKDLDNLKGWLDKENHPDNINQEEARMGSSQSMLLFSRKASAEYDVIPKSLEDFKILKVIDKGSFGKVFLVK